MLLLLCVRCEVECGHQDQYTPPDTNKKHGLITEVGDCFYKEASPRLFCVCVFFYSIQFDAVVYLLDRRCFSLSIINFERIHHFFRLSKVN